MTNPGKANAEIGKAVGIAIAAVVAVFVVGIVIAYASGVFSDTTVERRGETAQQEQTVGDPNYRIAQYGQFFDRCQAVIAAEGQIADTQAALPTDDPTQRFYDQQNLRALQGNRRSLISQYNADAEKTGTAEQFLSSHLPRSLDQNGATTCSR